jgi:hypothetical protein
LWRDIENDNRPTNSILSKIKFSPMTKPGTVPPGFVLTRYYEECKKNGDWGKVIELLKDAWDREFFDALKTQSEKPGQPPSNPKLGDEVGIPLMEAYLNDQKPALADEVFRAWLEVGGMFEKIARAVELAKEKGQERLSLEWERSLKK